MTMGSIILVVIIYLVGIFGTNFVDRTLNIPLYSNKPKKIRYLHKFLMIMIGAVICYFYETYNVIITLVVIFLSSLIEAYINENFFKISYSKVPYLNGITHKVVIMFFGFLASGILFS